MLAMTLFRSQHSSNSSEDSGTELQRPYKMVSENKNLFIAIVDQAGTSSSTPHPPKISPLLEKDWS